MIQKQKNLDLPEQSHRLNGLKQWIRTLEKPLNSTGEAKAFKVQDVTRQNRATNTKPHAGASVLCVCALFGFWNSVSESVTSIKNKGLSKPM